MEGGISKKVCESRKTVIHSMLLANMQQLFNPLPSYPLPGSKIGSQIINKAVSYQAQVLIVLLDFLSTILSCLSKLSAMIILVVKKPCEAPHAQYTCHWVCQKLLRFLFQILREVCVCGQLYLLSGEEWAAITDLI